MEFLSSMFSGLFSFLTAMYFSKMFSNELLKAIRAQLIRVEICTVYLLKWCFYVGNQTHRSMSVIKIFWGKCVRVESCRNYNCHLKPINIKKRKKVTNNEINTNIGVQNVIKRFTMFGPPLDICYIDPPCMIHHLSFCTNHWTHLQALLGV